MKNRCESASTAHVESAISSPSLIIQYRDIAELHPDPKNARIHNKKQVGQIAESIRVFGFNVPILIANDLIVAGHGRLEAARLLGIEKVPVISLDHLTAEQRIAFALADNRLTENASWDEKLLGQQLKFLADAGLNFSLEVTGFEIGEIDVFIEGLETPDGDDAAEEIPPTENQPQVSQVGDLWKLDRHLVLCGDALDTASYRQLLPTGRAAAVFTDVPYNVKIQGNVTGHGKVRHREFVQASGEMNQEEFTAFLTKALEAAAAVSTAGSIHFVCIDWRHLAELLSAGRQVYSELKNLCVWVKDAGGMGSFYRSQHELVFVFKHGEGAHRNNFQLGQYGRYRTNVWNYPGANSFSRNSEEGNLLALHPTPKPVAMVSDAILDVTQRGEIVLDPFLGSGTTVIAAERTGRVCCGMDLDPLYVDTIIRRWQKFTGKSAIHAESNRTFNEIQEKN